MPKQPKAKPKPIDAGQAQVTLELDATEFEKGFTKVREAIAEWGRQITAAMEAKPLVQQKKKPRKNAKPKKRAGGR